MPCGRYHALHYLEAPGCADEAKMCDAPVSELSDCGVALPVDEGETDGPNVKFEDSRDA